MGRDYYVKSSREKRVSDTIDTHSLHIDSFEAILDAMSYTDGTCCFNKERDGRLLIFEVNPRFGGSLFRDINTCLVAYTGAVAGG